MTDSGTDSRDGGHDARVPRKKREAGGAPAPAFVDMVEAGLAETFAYCGHLSQESMASFATYVRLRLLVALSGGPDSTALLSALAELAGRLAFTLSACHVNHHTRGEESDADEAFCRQLCLSLNIPLDVRHVEPGVSHSESALRDARYRLLTEAAHDARAHFVAVAHTLDDQIETLLFRLFRGTGLSGLVGMEPARRLSQTATLIRPLLSLRRRQCLDYVRERQIEPQQDSSNKNIEHTRNYIREKIIPPIEERFPGFQGRVEQLRQRIVAEESLLAEMSREALAVIAESGNGNLWDLGAFLSQPTALQRRLLSRALQARGIEVNFARVTSIMDMVHRVPHLPSSRLTLSAQWDVAVSEGKIRFLDKESIDFYESYLLGGETVLKVPGLTVVPQIGRALRIEPYKSEPGVSPKFPQARDWEAVVDLGQASPPLVLRGRQPGDAIRPFGMDQLVRLKKYLHNHKSREQAGASQWPLVVIADRDEVLWVPGVGLSNKIRVRDKPTHRLQWIVLAQDDVFYS